jgi:hypothetical protein
MNLHGVGLPYVAAMAVQLYFTVAAVVAVAWAFPTRADANPHLLFALFVTFSIAAVPYLLVCDTLALSFAALALLAGDALDTRGPGLRGRFTGCRRCRSTSANSTFRAPR